VLGEILSCFRIPAANQLGHDLLVFTELTWGIGEGGYATSKRSASKSAPDDAVDVSAKYAAPARAEARRREG
jgi:hypothetical protein